MRQASCRIVSSSSRQAAAIEARRSICRAAAAGPRVGGVWSRRRLDPPASRAATGIAESELFLKSGGCVEVRHVLVRPMCSTATAASPLPSSSSSSSPSTSPSSQSPSASSSTPSSSRSTVSSSDVHEASATPLRRAVVVDGSLNGTGVKEAFHDDITEHLITESGADHTRGGSQPQSHTAGESVDKWYTVEVQKFNNMIKSKLGEVEDLLDIASNLGQAEPLAFYGNVLRGLSATTTRLAVGDHTAKITCDERFFHFMTSLEHRVQYEARNPQCKPVEPAQVLLGLAVLKHNPGTTMIETLLKMWLKAVAEYRGEGPRGFSMVLSGLSRLRYSPAPSFWTDYANACVVYGIEKFSWAALAHVANGLVHYWEAPLPRGLLSVASRAVRGAHGEHSRAMAMLIDGLGRLSRRIEKSEGRDMRNDRLSAACALAKAYLQMSTYTCLSLATTIRGLAMIVSPIASATVASDGSMLTRATPMAMGELKGHVAAILGVCKSAGFDRFTTQQLCWILEGITRLAYDPGPGVIEEMVATAIDREVDACTAKDLRAILTQISYPYVHPPSTAVVKRLTNGLVKLGFDTLSTTDLARLISSLARLKVHPGKSFMRRFFHTCTQEDWQGFNIFELARVLQSLSLLRIRVPSGVWKSYTQAWHAALAEHRFRLRDYITVLHALAMCEYLHKEESLALLRALRPMALELIHGMAGKQSVEAAAASDAPDSRQTDMRLLRVLYHTVSFSRASLPLTRDIEEGDSVAEEGNEGRGVAVRESGSENKDGKEGMMNIAKGQGGEKGRESQSQSGAPSQGDMDGGDLSVGETTPLSDDGGTAEGGECVDAVKEELRVVLEALEAVGVTVPVDPLVSYSNKLGMARDLEAAGYNLECTAVLPESCVTVDILLKPLGRSVPKGTHEQSHHSKDGMVATLRPRTQHTWAYTAIEVAAPSPLDKRPVALELAASMDYLRDQPGVLTGRSHLRRRLLTHAIQRGMLRECFYVPWKLWEKHLTADEKVRLLEQKLKEAGIPPEDYRPTTTLHSKMHTAA